MRKLNVHQLKSDTYKSYWYEATRKKGYSGTGVMTKYKPIQVKYGMGIEKHDNEGRVLTLEYEKFYLITCYTPNSEEGLERIKYRVVEWDKDFFAFVNKLKEQKDIILCGDLNLSHNPIEVILILLENYILISENIPFSLRKFLNEKLVISGGGQIIL